MLTTGRDVKYLCSDLASYCRAQSSSASSSPLHATKPAAEIHMPRGIRLADARTLSYAEYGSPSGDPVLFLHGFPASQKEAALWHDAARRHSVRIIAPDRPGIGLSSYQPGRRFLDWPADVVQLTQHLGIASCHVLATAGGSPYALACLRAFDSGNGAMSGRQLSIKGTAIVSGIYPSSLGASRVQLSTRIALWIVGHIWFLLVPLLEWFMGKPARRDPELFKSRIMREADSRPLVDKKCLANPAFGAGFVESARHAFAGGARGVAYEAGLMGRAWCFDLDVIDGSRVFLFQGGFDEACPADMARKAHAKLAGSVLKVYEYEGHLSLLARRQDEVLDALLSNFKIS